MRSHPLNGKYTGFTDKGCRYFRYFGIVMRNATVEHQIHRSIEYSFLHTFHIHTSNNIQHSGQVERYLDEKH